jgi:hypothetical protein
LIKQGESSSSCQNEYGGTLKGEKMNKLPVFLAVAFLVSPVSALTYMGSPTSNVKQGDLLLGFDYSDSKLDVEWRGYGLKGTIKNVESDLYLGKVGLGLSDGFELFGRFGLNRMDYTLNQMEYTEDIQDGFRFNSGNEFAWGVGMKATLGRKDNLSWGALFQFMDFTGHDRSYFDEHLIDTEIDAYEIQLAIGPSYEIYNLCLYGGPFLHVIGGDVEMKTGSTTLSSFDIEQGSEAGGYIGLGWQFAKNSSLNVEYQLTGDARAIGISLLNRFGDQSKPEKPIVWQRPIPMPKPETKVDASGRVITGYHMKRNASGDFAKDKAGNFVFDPVYEEEQGK